MNVEFSDDFSSEISVFPASVETAKGCIVALFFSIISAFSPIVVPLSVISSSFRSSFSLAFLFLFPPASSFPLSSANSGNTVVHSVNEIVELGSSVPGSSVVMIVESVNVFVKHIVQELVMESASLVDVDSNNAVASVLLDNWWMKTNNWIDI